VEKGRLVSSDLLGDLVGDRFPWAEYSESVSIALEAKSELT
jgi:hypothetical protein